MFKIDLPMVKNVDFFEISIFLILLTVTNACWKPHAEAFKTSNISSTTFIKRWDLILTLLGS